MQNSTFQLLRLMYSRANVNPYGNEQILSGCKTSPLESFSCTRKSVFENMTLNGIGFRKKIPERSVYVDDCSGNCALYSMLCIIMMGKKEL